MAVGWELCNVNIVAGHYYGIIGARHDSGSTQMYNSYAVSPTTVTIDGNPTTLSRLILQSSLASGSPASGAYMSENSGSIGRVHFTTTSSSGCAHDTLNLTINNSTSNIVTKLSVIVILGW